MIPAIGVSVWLFVKILFLFAIVVYIVFALVVVRQVGLMTDTIEVGLEIPIRIVAWGHLLFTVGILILAILIL